MLLRVEAGMRTLLHLRHRPLFKAGRGKPGEGKQKFGIASDIFSFEPFALAVRRNDADFRLIADSVLAQLYRTGEISPIYAKWFGKFTKKVPPLLEAMYVMHSTPE